MVRLLSVLCSHHVIESPFDCGLPIPDGNAEAEGPAAHFKPINVPQPFQSRATIKDSPDKFIQQVTGPLRPVLDLMVNERSVYVTL